MSKGNSGSTRPRRAKLRLGTEDRQIVSAWLAGLSDSARQAALSLGPKYRETRDYYLLRQIEYWRNGVRLFNWASKLAQPGGTGGGRPRKL